MPRIAIIDDDASVRKSIELVLSADGHDAVSFPEAKQFLATADASEFDLLLVDNDMSQMTCLELHDWLQDQTVLRPNFVFMSDRISDDITESLESRGIVLLSNPFSLASLLQIVN